MSGQSMMYVKTDAGYIPVPAPPTTTTTTTDTHHAHTYEKKDEKVDPSLIKQMLLAVRRVYGDEAKQIQIKIHDPIPTTPGSDETGFKDITPLTVTIYYAKNRVYTGAKKEQEGTSKWIPREEYIAMKKREREEKDMIQQ